MTLKYKALTHYIINSTITILAIFFMIFALCFTETRFDITNSGEAMGWTFLSTFILMFLSLGITSIIFAEDNSNPFKVLFPLFITTLILALVLSFFSTLIFKWFDDHRSAIVDEQYWSIVFITVYTILVTIIMCLANLLSSRFCLASLSGNRANEWTINNTTDLVLSNSDVIHTDKFTYLYSKYQIWILHIVTEDQVERTIQFEDTERDSKNLIVVELEKELKRLSDKTNIKVQASIIYLSNNLPNQVGVNRTKITQLKSKDLFRNFNNKGLTTTSNISDIKELINNG